ncbi:SIR2 family protein [Sporosarcina sp. NCCP-2222]|uniref:SIR2 family protein n=1 Tax=Sporosarcina sp. NCCP-2222 TaxID=2935073 RepID=UPI0020BFDB4E|nr:SIR2 family protein [Sporosarcina sp. NCCP-2222]
MILDKLMSENEFPVVFIGAGLSKRFLEKFPDWTSLLEEFWNQLGYENFYGEYNNIRDEMAEENPSYSEKEINHYSNIRMGTILEANYNKAFNRNEVSIKGFTPKDAFQTRISPFKKAISERFGNYTVKQDAHGELEAFRKMLLKTQIILTTNYDEFIENTYNSASKYNITKYIGQKGFFQETFGFAELYKLHGCVESPNDIVITENDYSNFDKNSVLISAKIISMMLHSPIIFIGYSLTDINVRNIISEFTRSLNEEEIQILENRLVLIERLEGEKGFIEENINDKDLGCKLKVVKTDNFEEVFKKISKINQGIAPTEVRKYQHVIKELIIDRGKKGTLNSLLLSPEELDVLEEDILNKNITVALGDSKYIFQIPDLISYTIDYISDKDEISTEIRMRFAILQNATARFPINKILDTNLINGSSLHPTEKEKLIQKINTFSDFDKQYGTIVTASVFNRNTDQLQNIIGKGFKKENEYETISYNIQRLDLAEVKDYLLEELTELKEVGEIKINTQLRRLLLLYDILKNKRGNA